MKPLIALPLALGFALAAPISADAASSAYGPHHAYRAIHHRRLAMRAEAAAATIFAPARSPAFGDNETDGLSRNPEDCATYGCIDSGG